MNYNIALPFYEHSLRNPDALAISVDDSELSYKEFAICVQKISRWLQSNQGCSRVGILATRSEGACAAILGIGWAGKTYIPISLKLPEERLLAVLELSKLDALIVDKNGADLLSEAVIARCPSNILLYDDISPPFATDKIHKFNALPVNGYEHNPVLVTQNDIAYIIFTSGSTGIPKGVMVSAASLRYFAEVMQQIYQFVPNDRVAETADISFDLSVGNMFITWRSGASLHVVPATQALAPVAFIQNHKLTVWFSVPSVISLMHQMGLLKPKIFSTLRYSLFIGEPLSVSSAEAWQKAAPNSIIENLYGPTEATVACTRQRIDGSPVITPEHDTIAIGRAFFGTEVAIFDSEFRLRPANIKGELALSGIQLAVGYLNDPKMTDSRFPIIDGKRWYLTGDVAMYDTDGILHHLGRIDNQVKVLGYRVELEDIEAHLREISDSGLVAAIAWPVRNGSASGIVGFVSHSSLDPEHIKAQLKKLVPSYMVPSIIYSVDTLPLSANGKIDRKKLVELLDAKKAKESLSSI